MKSGFSKKAKQGEGIIDVPSGSVGGIVFQKNGRIRSGALAKKSRKKKSNSF